MDQKFDFVFQIWQTPKIPQKWFSAQNGLLVVRSQMRQTLTKEAPELWRNQANQAIFLKYFLFIFFQKKAPMVGVSII